MKKLLKTEKREKCCPTSKMRNPVFMSLKPPAKVVFFRLLSYLSEMFTSFVFKYSNADSNLKSNIYLEKVSDKIVKR